MNVDVSNKQLLISCSSAWQKYFADLEDHKKKHEEEATSKKCKVIETDIESWKKKEMVFEKDVESLMTDADNLAFIVQKQLNVLLVEI